MAEEKITQDQLDRLFSAIEWAFPGDVHIGDVLSSVQKISGRDVDTYWELTKSEAEKVIHRLDKQIN